MNNNLTIVILNYNDYKTTLKLYNRIKEYDAINHIIIVDNCSTDNSYEIIKKNVNTKCDVILTDSNKGYSYGNNYGIKYAIRKYSCDYIIVSNPDVIFDESILLRMMEVMTNDNTIGVVAPMMRNIDERINYRCVWKIPTKKQYIITALLINKFIQDTYYYKPNELNKMKVVGCVAGSFFMINCKAMEKIGYFDENVFLFCEETMLGINMNKNGYLTVLLPDIYFIHAHSVSIKKSIKSEYNRNQLLVQSRVYVLEKYYSCSKQDLFFIKLLFSLDINIRRIKECLKSKNYSIVNGK